MKNNIIKPITPKQMQFGYYSLSSVIDTINKELVKQKIGLNEYRIECYGLIINDFIKNEIIAKVENLFKEVGWSNCNIQYTNKFNQSIPTTILSVKLTR